MFLWWFNTFPDMFIMFQDAKDARSVQMQKSWSATWNCSRTMANTSVNRWHADGADGADSSDSHMIGTDGTGDPRWFKVIHLQNTNDKNNMTDKNKAKNEDEMKMRWGHQVASWMISTVYISPILTSRPSCSFPDFSQSHVLRSSQSDFFQWPGVSKCVWNRFRVAWTIPVDFLWFS